MPKRCVCGRCCYPCWLLLSVLVAAQPVAACDSTIKGVGCLTTEGSLLCGVLEVTTVFCIARCTHGNGQVQKYSVCTHESHPLCLQLFKSASPGDTDNWLADMDKDSEQVLTNVFISSRLEGCEPLERFQLERLGFFCVDRDTTAGRVVLNRTCSLRDTYVRKMQ